METGAERTALPITHASPQVGKARVSTAFAWEDERETGCNSFYRKELLVVRFWAQQDLNLRPADYESAALTKLSYGPEDACRRY